MPARPPAHGRLQFTSQPVYENVAWLSAHLTVLVRPWTRQIARAALGALGHTQSRSAIRRFALQCSLHQWTEALLGVQADRLTASWIAQHVALTQTLPAGGCILVSIHQYNQRLAYGRLSAAVADLGVVSTFEPFADSDPALFEAGRLLSIDSAYLARSRYARRVFGSRMYRPGPESRRGLELLQQGGSLITLADLSPSKRAMILGRQASFAGGVLWFAERSGKPVVPFVLEAIRRSHWRVAIGAPLEPTPEALLAMVEGAIRRVPTTWSLWRDWFSG